MATRISRSPSPSTCWPPRVRARGRCAAAACPVPRRATSSTSPLRPRRLRPRPTHPATDAAPLDNPVPDAPPRPRRTRRPRPPRAPARSFRSSRFPGRLHRGRRPGRRAGGEHRGAGPGPDAPPGPADKVVTVEADWTHADQPAADQAEVWSLHGRPGPGHRSRRSAGADHRAGPGAGRRWDHHGRGGPAARRDPAPDEPGQPAAGNQHRAGRTAVGSERELPQELWHAVQTQEISKNDALMALAQRPMTTPVTNDPRMGSVPAAPADPAAPEVPVPADAPPAQ